MRIIYQKEAQNEEGETIYVDCDESEATHKLISYHDEANILGEAKPCKRIKL